MSLKTLFTNMDASNSSWGPQQSVLSVSPPCFLFQVSCSKTLKTECNVNRLLTELRNRTLTVWKQPFLRLLYNGGWGTLAKVLERDYYITVCHHRDVLQDWNVQPNKDRPSIISCGMFVVKVSLISLSIETVPSNT